MSHLSPDHLTPLLAVSALDLIDPQQLVASFGLIGLVIVVFLESWFAFFLPGDSLLFAAGFLSADPDYELNIIAVCAGITIAAIAGNQIGYLTGRRLGPALFDRPNSRFFKQEHLIKTHAYFEHHGPKTIVIARFLPIVRSFACIVAGAAKMDYRVFVTYNIVGGVLWGTGLTLVGWIVATAVGRFVDIDTYLFPILAVVFVVALIPMTREWLRAKRHFDAPLLEVDNTLKHDIQP